VIAPLAINELISKSFFLSLLRPLCSLIIEKKFILLVSALALLLCFLLLLCAVLLLRFIFRDERFYDAKLITVLWLSEIRDEKLRRRMPC
jgi:hypothetical protein